MNFSIGFFIGGQVLAGILGSVVTLPYGPEGKHGANYMQTLAASVAGMCGMGVLMQAMVWMGLPQPPVWQLVLWVLFWGAATVIIDWNPISSAFVLTVFILASLGLKDAGVGLMCASILLIACSEGGDMQQDRSTGWRLGTNRVNQFRYQVIGIAMGAVLAVVLAKTFMTAYPVLTADQYGHKVAGDSLAALSVGLYGLITSGALQRIFGG